MSTFKVKGEMSLDGSKFIGGIRQAEIAATKFGSKISSSVGAQLAGLFTLGAASAFAKTVTNINSHYRDLSDTLGVNVEWLQKMKNAAGQAGGNIDDVAQNILKLNQSRGAAINNPDGSQAQAFSRAGMTQADIKGLSTQAFAEKFYKAFAGNLTVQAENDFAAVGGKASKRLIAAFSQGLELSGPVVPEGIIDQLDELGDAFFLLKEGALTDAAPVLTGLANFVKEFLDGWRLAWRTIGAAAGGIGTAKGMNASARQAQEDFANEILERDKKLETLRAGRIKARRERENAPPSFAVDATKEPKSFGKIQSDTLLAVGNFLGAGRDSVARVAERQLSELQNVNRTLRDISSRMNQGDELGLP